MIATLIISFKEFFEAFLVIGVFLGVSKKLKLKKEFEIILATVIGVTLSLILATFTYYFSNNAQIIFNEKNKETLENYLLIFSGFFIIYTVISLHNLLHKIHGKIIDNAHQKLQNSVFDISLFFTIVFLVFREGFEIALFTASTALFSVFLQNFIGLILGFILASIFGLLIFFTYLKLSIKKVFKITEYIIVLTGITMIINGVYKILITFKPN